MKSTSDTVKLNWPHHPVAEEQARPLHSAGLPSWFYIKIPKGLRLVSSFGVNLSDDGAESLHVRIVSPAQCEPDKLVRATVGAISESRADHGGD